VAKRFVLANCLNPDIAVLQFMDTPDGGCQVTDPRNT
jgi:hypothetical protein